MVLLIQAKNKNFMWFVSVKPNLELQMKMITCVLWYPDGNRRNHYVNEVTTSSSSKKNDTQISKVSLVSECAKILDNITICKIYVMRYRQCHQHRHRYIGYTQTFTKLFIGIFIRMHALSSKHFCHFWMNFHCKKFFMQQIG